MQIEQALANNPQILIERNDKMPEIITDETLAKINKFTHRELSADEVYVSLLFSVTMKLTGITKHFY